MVRLLIEKGAEINKTALSRSSGPKTALEAACWGGHEDVVRLLIAEGADVNSGEKHTHCSALRWTMNIRSKSGARSLIARILLENGAKVDFMGSTICLFIRSDDVDIVNLLLDRCSDVDERSADGRTPMEIACEVGDEDTVRTLLDRGADTAVGCCVASVAGGPGTSEDVRMRILHLVVAAGADVNARGQGTYCGALHGACQQTREKMFHMLLDLGAKIHSPGNKGGTLIHAVVSSSKMMRKEGDSDAEQTKLRRILGFLVGEGLDINAQGPSGSPLQMASVNDSTSNLPMLRYLVEKGADVNAQGGDCRRL
jgi:ankyrin repeat protein